MQSFPVLKTNSCILLQNTYKTFSHLWVKTFRAKSDSLGLHSAQLCTNYMVTRLVALVCDGKFHWRGSSLSYFYFGRTVRPSKNDLRGPVHSLSKPRSMCSKCAKIVSWFQNGGQIFFQIRLDLVKISHNAKNLPIRSKMWPMLPL